MVKESNLPPSASQLDGNGFTGRREEHHPRNPAASSTGGTRTHRTPGFEPGCFAGLRTVPSLTYLIAPPAGFEPATSSLTTRRALRTAPRRRDQRDGSGGSRTLSISRSKREWSAGCLPSRKRPESRGHYPGWDSNPQAPGFKPGRSARWRTWARRSGSRGTRTHERPQAATCFQDRPLIRPDGFREA